MSSSSWPGCIRICRRSIRAARTKPVSPGSRITRRIRPEYFDAADRRIEYLADQGITPCIVGAWGYFMPWMGVDKVKQQWRYLIARYGALPVVWCAAGEANLPWYLAKGFPFDDRKQVTQWTEVMRYIRATDPFHRPLTIHPTGIGRLSARNATDDAALLDIDMLQTPHGQREAVEPTVRTVQQSYAEKPRMPVIDGEAAYEMLNDTLPTKWTRQMFWLCMTNGAAGHTYGANGIWQCNRRGEPHGKSPHGGDYGHIPWDDAMKLPGSRQVGLGKKLFEKYEWYKFEPHPEWATYAPESAGRPTPGSYGPYATGIPGKVRIIYVPESRTVRVTKLESHVKYRAHSFDPTNGEESELGAVTTESQTGWEVKKPASIGSDDWVLVIKRADKRSDTP